MLNLQKKLDMFHLFPQPILHSNVKEKTPPCFVSNLFLWFSLFTTPSSLQGNEKCHKQHLKTHFCHVTWSKLIIPNPDCLFLMGLDQSAKSRVQNCIFTIAPQYSPQGQIQTAEFKHCSNVHSRNIALIWCVNWKNEKKLLVEKGPQCQILQKFQMKVIFPF